MGGGRVMNQYSITDNISHITRESFKNRFCNPEQISDVTAMED